LLGDTPLMSSHAEQVPYDTVDGKKALGAGAADLKPRL